MSTGEQLKEPSLEQQIEFKLQEILAAQAIRPRNPHWPRYWQHESKESQIFGVASSTTHNEGAVKSDKDGNRVDIAVRTQQTSLLGIKRSKQKSFSVTRYDHDVEGMHTVEVNPIDGHLQIASQAQHSTDKGQLLREKMVFKRGMPEYEGTLISILTLLEGLNEAD